MIFKLIVFYLQNNAADGNGLIGITDSSQGCVNNDSKEQNYSRQKWWQSAFKVSAKASQTVAKDATFNKQIPTSHRTVVKTSVSNLYYRNNSYVLNMSVYHFRACKKSLNWKSLNAISNNQRILLRQQKNLPVYSFHDNENFPPRSVSPGLSVYNGIFQNFL